MTKEEYKTMKKTITEYEENIKKEKRKLEKEYLEPFKNMCFEGHHDGFYDYYIKILDVKESSIYEKERGANCFLLIVSSEKIYTEWKHLKDLEYNEHWLYKMSEEKFQEKVNNFLTKYNLI